MKKLFSIVLACCGSLAPMSLAKGGGVKKSGLSKSVNLKKSDLNVGKYLGKKRKRSRNEIVSPKPPKDPVPINCNLSYGKAAGGGAGLFFLGGLIGYGTKKVLDKTSSETHVTGKQNADSKNQNEDKIEDLLFLNDEKEAHEVSRLLELIRNKTRVFTVKKGIGSYTIFLSIGNGAAGKFEFEFNYIFGKNLNKLVLSKVLFGNFGVVIDINLEKSLGDGYGDLLEDKDNEVACDFAMSKVVEINSAKMYEAVCDMAADRLVEHLSHSFAIKSKITDNSKLRDFISGYIGTVLKNNGRGGLGTFKISNGEENYFRLCK